jgi:hypothetical protein
MIGGGGKKTYILRTGTILFKSVKLVLYPGLEAHKPNVDRKDKNNAS